MSIDAQTLLIALKTRTGFSADHQALLKENTDWALALAPDMANHFYEYLGRDPEMNSVLNKKEGSMHRLHSTFVQWFHEMFTGMDNWGEAYAERRWRVGLVHVQIGIGPQHVVPAMAIVVQEFGKRLLQAEKPEALREALGTIAMIDLAFIEQAYMEVAYNAVQKETGWTEGLFKRLVSTGASTL
ncbi:protoglobin domain-containing protein [Leptolyngbya sp. FACHB-261]|uniref:protoglobin domain-containing protein n=1 Tax=Leptolyngbya sp. FACHB-261 TaxID=2692806 RepID=UPI00168566E6|nr:protoglobin domain-containing protein [Leptolyngbya sp. FACHB-261]MBD2102989.1 hypothetical protein [Leptolyngbya sp. FACHB-261]